MLMAHFNAGVTSNVDETGRNKKNGELPNFKEANNLHSPSVKPIPGKLSAPKWDIAKPSCNDDKPENSSKPAQIRFSTQLPAVEKSDGPPKPPAPEFKPTLSASLVQLKNTELSSRFEGSTDLNSNSLPVFKPSVVKARPDIQNEKPNVTEGLLSEDGKGSLPKRKPLPGMTGTGKCPPKPRRPFHVDLSQFGNKSPQINNSAGPPPPPVSSHPEALRKTVPDKHGPVTAGVRNNKTLFQAQEEQALEVFLLMQRQNAGGNEIPPKDDTEVYDDVETPGNAGDEFQDTEDDDTYEDVDDEWSENKPSGIQQDSLKKETKKDKKLEKEEKKKLEQKKKEREKRENEARKKFQLKGSIQVFMMKRVQVECKGGKNDLQLRSGETVEIVRIKDNPAGQWLARNKTGQYGYVKTEAFGGDNNQKQDGGGDMYDDVDETSFPPPPPPAYLTENNDDIYDDVESQDFPLPPPPPPLDSHPLPKPKESQEMELRKMKKFEKEFRKSFKYTGGISVLYQVAVNPTLTTKKWSRKELPLKPGEMIDVIIKLQNNKLVGRNTEGKFGLVCTDNVQIDSEIYDDVGEDCVYDND
ncbi:FYN-binding protein 1-like [Denticeps clupeoides]|uniref:FYN-binding protein 1-like n=1 Tax=Denticeps clupeoides TaxID=299321 RepID=UPI0010A3F7B4|nr:FYN-binding protein 1-like [Denticeps clupeoides]